MINISTFANRPALPIDTVIADLQKALAGHPCAVLQAEPGAGKTTGVPLALWQAPWLAGRKIVMLEPRRMAARAAAMRMSDLVGEAVGRTIGYRVRMDSRVSDGTRIEVVTEGVLTRMLQSDPGLSGVGLVIFDEFHERSLDADLGLALCREMQGVLNPDLRVLVMSATIETEPLAAMLDHAPVITCPGRQWPVDTRYVGSHMPVNSVDAVVQTVLAAARNESGSILVFLPGAAEIGRAARQLHQAGLGPDWLVAPLYGNLTRNAQDRAVAAPADGQRKIVLATSIAETSLTIEGIRVVVDSGLQRIPRFDVRSGLTRLVTVPVSQASADQRRGRAGRTGPGICLRMWSRHVHATLPAARRPEILEADLAGTALELALWGVPDPGALCWLDPPPEHAYQGARNLLMELGALDAAGRPGPHARKLANLPVHPRLAHMMVQAARQGLGGLACDLAALIGERDPIRFDSGRQDEDMQLRIDLLESARRERSWISGEARPKDSTWDSHQGVSNHPIDRFLLRRIVRTAALLRRRLDCPPGEIHAPEDIGRLLAWAYPDRIAGQRANGRGKYLLVNGRGAWIKPTAALASEPFLVAVELDGERREARIFRAAGYSPDLALEQFADRLERNRVVEWDGARQMVIARRDLKLGSLTLRSEALDSPDPGQVLAAMLEGIRRQGLECLPWTRILRQWQQRACFLKRMEAARQSWPDISDQGLQERLDQWLAPYLSGIHRLRDLSRIDLKAALFSQMTYDQQRLLNEWAPTHLTVPSGSCLPVDYSGEMPVLAVRLQEMFGLAHTPTVAGGRQPVLLHLLSPAGRPVQITQDLAGFWKMGYPEVKKELKGRYPKHYWPDDPLRAQATARAKPKSRTHHGS